MPSAKTRTDRLQQARVTVQSPSKTRADRLRVARQNPCVTRKERLAFDVAQDLKARQLLKAVAKGYGVRKTIAKKKSLKLVRTKHFLLCKKCHTDNSRINDNCEKCGSVLSSRPSGLWRIQ